MKLTFLYKLMHAIPSVLYEEKLRLLKSYRVAQLRRKFPRALIGDEVVVYGVNNIILSDGASIETGVILHGGGGGWCDYRGKIQVGERTYIGPHCILFGAGGIELGSNCLVSPGVIITSHQHTFARIEVSIRQQPIQFSRVVIEDDVWIGSNVVILPGVTIGRGAVIGAGAVVTEDIPPHCVAVGVPAKVIKKRTMDSVSGDE